MQNLFLLECSPRVFIFFLYLKKHLKTFFFIAFLSGPSFANDISVEDTLIIHPISFSMPSPEGWVAQYKVCLLYTSPSPRDVEESRMPSSA